MCTVSKALGMGSGQAGGVYLIYLPPSILVPGAREHGGRPAERDHLEVLPPELCGHRELLPALPAGRPLAELRHHRRVVADLQFLNFESVPNVSRKRLHERAFAKLAMFLNFFKRLFNNEVPTF